MSYEIDPERRERVVQWLAERQPSFPSLFPIPRQGGNYVALDLSRNNTGLQALGIVDTTALTDYIFREISSHGAQVGFGGYNEDRAWYQRADFFAVQGEPRTIHIGVDLWAKPGTPVILPIAGHIHSLQDNNRFGDYGPTLIFEHEVDGAPFYSLYGHLSVDSLRGKQPGQHFEAGTHIAAVGAPPRNGDWPPHVHFQLMLDMLGMQGDFPAVCVKSQRDYYLALCPNPELVLGLQSGVVQEGRSIPPPL